MDGRSLPTLLAAVLLLAAPLALATEPLAPAAEPRLGPSRLQAMLASPGVAAGSTARGIFDVHFAGLCWTPEIVPFERLCNHIPIDERDDPSPWPDVFVALQGPRIVAVIVPGTHWVPPDWQCRALLPDFEGPRLCTAPGVSRATRNDRAWRWNRLLRSAG